MLLSENRLEFAGSIPLQVRITLNNKSTVVEADSKGPFSIATTLRSSAGLDSFPLITLLYPWSVTYNAES